MKVLRETSLTKVLADWGRHEALGRFSSNITPSQKHELSGPNGEGRAIETLFKWRGPVLFPILLAHAKRFLSIEVLPDDIIHLRILGRPSKPLAVAVSSEDQRIDQDNTYISRLASAQNQLQGPLLAVARNADGPFILLDGIHRAIAWILQAERGNSYPMVLNVVITQEQVRGWE